MKAVRDRLVEHALVVGEVQKARRLEPEWEDKIRHSVVDRLDFESLVESRRHVSWSTLIHRGLVSDDLIWAVRDVIPARLANVANYGMQKRLWDYYTAKRLLPWVCMAAAFIAAIGVWGLVKALLANH